jgi:hypothetical protein
MKIGSRVKGNHYGEVFTGSIYHIRMVSIYEALIYVETDSPVAISTVRVTKLCIPYNQHAWQNPFLHVKSVK